MIEWESIKPMQKKIFVAYLVIFILVSSCLTAFSGTMPSVNSRNDIAQRVMSKLIAGDIQAAVGQIHEPATYDREHADEDRRSLSEDLAFLLQRFGNVSTPRLAQSLVEFYLIEIAGGDVPYWQSLPDFGYDARATYLVNFSKVGPGVVVIDLTRASGSWELRSIGLGLERSRPHSREIMLRIGKSFFSQQYSMLKDEIERILEAMFGASADSGHL